MLIQNAYMYSLWESVKNATVFRISLQQEVKLQGLEVQVL